MKTKFLPQLFLISGLAIAYLTLSSDKNGRYNSASGCNSCHGNSASSATTVSLSGIPASGYVVGQTYTLTLSVSNSVMPKAGFSLVSNIGTMTAGTNSKKSGLSLTHSTPTTAVSGVTTWTFNWTAPASGLTTATFNVAGNAVNGNNSDDSGDQWNTASFSYAGNYPASVATQNMEQIKCYPNPAQNHINIKGLAKNSKVSVINIFGLAVQTAQLLNNDIMRLDCSTLAAGMYTVVVENEGKIFQTKFNKL